MDPGISDHFAQIIKVNQICSRAPVVNSSNITYRKINAGTINEFKYHYTKLDSVFTPETMNTDDCFNRYFDHFMWCYDLAFIKCKKTVLQSTKNKKIKINFSNELRVQVTHLQNINWLRKHTTDDDINDQYKVQKRIIGATI
ncbi:hypothetical protein QE152_g4148 [Popillia japonica]|uniref:Uncharacterized protein n=1 Tax=Popillia japonica TaxID=7064 RepID=A0AAW1N097_POPJA